MTQPKLVISHRAPSELSAHPALNHIPLPGDDELKAVRSGLAQAGEHLPPILIDAEGLILDDTSRLHWLCAKARQLKEVPVCIAATVDVHLAILRDLACRRHWSKSAIAYLAVPHLQPALDAARLRKLEKLRKNPEKSVGASSTYEARTYQELAAELGISEDMLKRAINVHKAFEDPNKYAIHIEGGASDGDTEHWTLREWFEPKLLKPFVGGEHENNRPMGLGGILAGITAVKAGDPGKFNPKARGQLNLFENKVDVVSGWKHWAKLSSTEKELHFKNFAERLERIPAPQRPALAEYFEQLAEKCRDKQVG